MFGVTLDDIEYTSNVAAGMEQDVDDYYFIAKKSGLDALISKLLFPKYKTPGIKLLLHTEKTCVLSAKMAMYCEVCEESICEDYLC